MNHFRAQYDCTDVQANTDSINQMNRYFQVNSLPELEFKHEQLGPSHEPLFRAIVLFESCEFSAQGRTKKDCEKKIKSYIWKLVSEEILVIESKAKKKIKNEEAKAPRFTPFINFKEMLSREFKHCDRPVLIIDLENLGEKALYNPQFKSICASENIGVICVSSRFVPENDGEIKFIRRDDFHRDSADEGIRRVIYYLMDHLNFTKIGLITMDHFGQNLKDIFIETDEKFFLFRDIEEFNVKYFRLTQEGLKGGHHPQKINIKDDSSGKSKEIEPEQMMINPSAPQEEETEPTTKIEPRPGPGPRDVKVENGDRV